MPTRHQGMSLGAAANRSPWAAFRRQLAVGAACSAVWLANHVVFNLPNRADLVALSPCGRVRAFLQQTARTDQGAMRSRALASP